MEKNNSLKDPHWFDPGFIGPYFDITARRDYLMTRAHVLAELTVKGVLDGSEVTWYALRWKETAAALQRLEDYTASRINWGMI